MSDEAAAPKLQVQIDDDVAQGAYSNLVLLNHTEKSKHQDLAISPEELADEVDLASSDLNQSLTLRLRDRELALLQKIEEALAKIDNGTFGLCENCEEPIDVKRLDARPVAELCIRCKEAQELKEKIYA